MLANFLLEPWTTPRLMLTPWQELVAAFEIWVVVVLAWLLIVRLR